MHVHEYSGSPLQSKVVGKDHLVHHFVHHFVDAAIKPTHVPYSLMLSSAVCCVFLVRTRGKLLPSPNKTVAVPKHLLCGLVLTKTCPITILNNGR